MALPHCEVRAVTGVDGGGLRAHVSLAGHRERVSQLLVRRQVGAADRATIVAQPRDVRPNRLIGGTIDHGLSAAATVSSAVPVAAAFARNPIITRSVCTNVERRVLMSWLVAIASLMANPTLPM